MQIKIEIVFLKEFFFIVLFLREETDSFTTKKAPCFSNIKYERMKTKVEKSKLIAKFPLNL